MFLLKNLGMGAFLVLLNLAVVGFTFFLSCHNYQREEEQHGHGAGRGGTLSRIINCSGT